MQEYDVTRDNIENAVKEYFSLRHKGNINDIVMIITSIGIANKIPIGVISDALINGVDEAIGSYM